MLTPSSSSTGFGSDRSASASLRASSSFATSTAFFASRMNQPMPPVPIAAISSGMVGSGVSESSPRNPQIRKRAIGCEASWFGISIPMFCSPPARATMRPAAIATMKAGIWETRPSPIESMPNTEIDCSAVQPCISIAIANPPMMLTPVMMMPAIASPRTNFEAPSIAP